MIDLRTANPEDFQGNFDDLDGECAEFSLDGVHVATAYTHIRLGGDVTVRLAIGQSFMNPATGDPFFASREVIPALQAYFEVQ